jgi:hypothetical protein
MLALIQKAFLPAPSLQCKEGCGLDQSEQAKGRPTNGSSSYDAVSASAFCACGSLFYGVSAYDRMAYAAPFF